MARLAPLGSLALPVAAVLLAAGAAAAAGVPAGAGEVASIGGKIAGERSVGGRLRVTEDLLVLPGATLRIAPGTVLEFERSDSTKVDPEYFYGGTELVVRGTLEAEGAQFRFAGRTGGIVVDGGRARLADCAVSGAEAGITALRGGRIEPAGVLRIGDCRVGAALFPGAPDAWGAGGGVLLAGNGIGAVRFPRAMPLPRSFRSSGNEEADILDWGGSAAGPPGPGAAPPAPAPGALRLGDTFVDRSRTLSGDVVVDGVLRVAPGATLTVLPGSRIFFTFRDTDGDGIGESGLFLQGNLDARGTEERPIGFHPEDPGPEGAAWGRWDSINFMASEHGENLLRHVSIDGAYRGLHAHFSRIRAEGIRIARCYRGLQFQESDVGIVGIEVRDANSALRCRDSDVRLERFVARDTISGGNFLRSAVKIVDPAATGGWYGFRFRESRVDLAGGSVREGLVGVSVQEGTVAMSGVSVGGSGLSGIAVQDGDVKITGCSSKDGLLDGLSATRGKVSVAGGAVSENGRYAVKMGGPAEVKLSGVAVSAGKRAPETPFFDGKVSPGLGIVTVE